MFPAHSLLELLARRKAAAMELQQHLAGVDRLSLSQYTERRARGELTVEQAYAYSLRRKREAQVSFVWFVLADAIGAAQGQRVAALLCLAGALFFLAVLVDSELALWRLRGGVGGLATLMRRPGWWHGLFDGERFGLRLSTVQVKA
jgi:hypothetical protein